MIDLSLDTNLARQILTGFIRSEITRMGFQHAVVALSGGIDSALSCYLAAEALGAANVLAVRMPYKTSSADSLEHAQMVIDALGVQSLTIPISEMVDPLLARFPEMDALAADRMHAWSPKLDRADFAPSAQNMAAWLALRQMDLAPLQQPLTALGLSSLGRLEGHVEASLTAVTAALARIAGQAAPEFPDPASFDAPSDVLAARRDALFGPQEPGDRFAELRQGRRYRP